MSSHPAPDGPDAGLPAQQQYRRPGPAGLYLAFVGLGTTGAVVPAAIPALAQLSGVPTALLLPAVPTLFAGLFVGVAVSPAVAHRTGTRRTVAAGALLQALALWTLAAAGAVGGAGVVIAAAGVAGIGFGTVEAGGTALTRVLRASTSGTLTGLTAVTALTAAGTPLALVAAGPDGVGLVLGAVTVPHLLAAAALLRSSDAPPAPLVARSADGLTRTTRWTAIALFCYVGAETLLSGWSAALTQAALGLSAQTAAVGTSAFWILLATGRLLALAATRRGAEPRTVLAVCQIGSATSLAAGVATTAVLPGAVVVPAILVGSSVALMGPCYALLLGRGVDAANERSASSTAAALVAAGALGGAVWAAAVAGTPAPLQLVTVALAACLAMTASRLAAGRSASTGTRGAGD